MKTQLTKRMEKALIIDALGKSKHPALEVEYWHTESIGAGIYRPVGQAEDVGDWDKVISLSDAIQDSGHNIGKAADKINVAIKKGMHIG